MKSFLQNNNTEIYSMSNEGKSVVNEKLINTFEKNIYISI